MCFTARQRGGEHTHKLEIRQGIKPVAIVLIQSVHIARYKLIGFIRLDITQSGAPLYQQIRLYVIFIFKFQRLTRCNRRHSQGKSDIIRM